MASVDTARTVVTAIVLTVAILTQAADGQAHKHYRSDTVASAPSSTDNDPWTVALKHVHASRGEEFYQRVWGFEYSGSGPVSIYYTGADDREMELEYWVLRPEEAGAPWVLYNRPSLRLDHETVWCHASDVLLECLHGPDYTQVSRIHPSTMGRQLADGAEAVVGTGYRLGPSETEFGTDITHSAGITFRKTGGVWRPVRVELSDMGEGVPDPAHGTLARSYPNKRVVRVIEEAELQKILGGALSELEDPRWAVPASHRNDHPVVRPRAASGSQGSSSLPEAQGRGSSSGAPGGATAARSGKARFWQPWRIGAAGVVAVLLVLLVALLVSIARDVKRRRH